MKSLLQEMVFPLSWEKGTPRKGIKAQRMHQLAQQSVAMKKQELEDRMEEHHRFLQEGGAGGIWQTLQVGGMVVAIYNKKSKTTARQFSIEYGRLAAGLNFVGLTLPFLNACAAFLPELNATGATLPASLFTDCYLEGANFQSAQLEGVDFSRADLRSVNFQNTNLSNVDFENCDLRDADFRGARIVGARFPGAQLEGVVS